MALTWTQWVSWRWCQVRYRLHVWWFHVAIFLGLISPPTDEQREEPLRTNLALLDMVSREIDRIEAEWETEANATGPASPSR